MYSRYGHRYLYILLPIVALALAMLVHVPLWAYQGSVKPDYDFVTSFLNKLYTWMRDLDNAKLNEAEVQWVQIMSFNDIAYIVVGLLMTAGVFKRDLEGPGIYRIVREHTRVLWFLRKSLQLLLMSFLYASTYILFVGCLVITKGNYAWSNLATVLVYCLHATLLLWLFALIINIVACYVGGAIGFGIGILIFGALFLLHIKISLSATSSFDPTIQFDLRYNPISHIGVSAADINAHSFFLLRSLIYCIICGIVGALAISRKDLSLRHSEA